MSVPVVPAVAVPAAATGNVADTASINDTADTSAETRANMFEVE